MSKRSHKLSDFYTSTGDLLPAERTLIAAMARGEPANVGPAKQPIEEAAAVDNMVRAELLRALGLGQVSDVVVPEAGLSLVGARISGVLDLQVCQVPHRLRFVNCVFEAPVQLVDAETQTLVFNGSRLSSNVAAGICLAADGLKTRGGLFLRNGFHANGVVRLLGAEIGGNLDCTAARFENPGGDALIADGLVAKGGVFMSRGFHATGSVRMLRARIGANLSCDGGRFENAGRVALGADGASIEGGVYLRNGFHAEGEVRLLGVEVGGNLECDGAQIDNPGDDALSADGLVAKGGVFLREGFLAKGEVRLLNARIGGNLECDAGRIENPAGCALNADRLSAVGHLFLRKGFLAQGETRLVFARVQGNIECDAGRFEAPGRLSLNAERLSVAGHLFLRNGCAVKGEARLASASVGGDLDCDAALFENPEGDALIADGASVNGAATLQRGFQAIGAVRFRSARIARDLNVSARRLTNPDGDALSVRNARIGGALTLRRDAEATSGGAASGGASTTTPIDGRLDLRGAAAAALDDAPESWPEAGKLALDGFEYARLVGAAPTDAKARLDWLQRQTETDLGAAFRPQPFRQLIAALEIEGCGFEARRIGVAMERRRRKGRIRGWAFGWPQRLLHRLYGATVGYGYWTARALLWAIGFTLLGAGVFAEAWKGGAIVPEDHLARRGYPWRGCDEHDPQPAACLRADRLGRDFLPFDPWVYSLETLLPAVSLGQDAVWMVSPDRGWRVENAAFLRGELGGETGAKIGLGVASTLAHIPWAGEKILRARIGALARGYEIFQRLVGWVLAACVAVAAARRIRR